MDGGEAADPMPNHTPLPTAKRRAESGIGLLLTVVLLLLTAVVTGLGVDVGQLYIARLELQGAADAAAVAAAGELDGTREGLERARRKVSAALGILSPPKRAALTATLAKPPEVSFASALDGEFRGRPASPARSRAVRVDAVAKVSLYLLPLAPGVPASSEVRVSAVAGQEKIRSAPGGLSPFAIEAANPQDSEFGLTCGDRFAFPGTPAGACGAAARMARYVDFGQSADRAGFADAVLNRSYYLPRPMRAGSELRFLEAPAEAEPVLARLYRQDSDTVSGNYRSYAGRGNGRRLLVAAVYTGESPALVVGFAGLLLHRLDRWDEGEVCAEYVGPSPVVGAAVHGAGPPGLYEVKLIR